MGYDSEDEGLSQEITLGLIFFIIIIYQKFHYIEMFFHGIKMRFLMRVYKILEFFNRTSVKLTLVLILVIVFFLVIWKVLLWTEKKINQYEKRKAKSLLKNLEKPNPLFPEVRRKSGMFQKIFHKNGRIDGSFFQSKEFENEDCEEKEEEEEENMVDIEDTLFLEAPKVFDEGSDVSPDIQCPSNQEIPKIIENKTKEVTESQRNQTKKKVKKSSFFEDKDILGLR